MGSTVYWPRPSAPMQPGDEFEALRAAFCERLYSDRVELLQLSEQLARPDSDPPAIYYRVHTVAHRVCGAAAMFEAAEIAAAAIALEQAALAATKPDAERAEAGAQVRSALQDLIELLPTSGR
jgi:HPt (histidine-containing phosphotransfer) domain-containing protein